MCNTTHVNTMSLTTLGLCSMVPSSTLIWLIFQRRFPPPPSSGDPAVGYSFFLCELSSALRFHHPWTKMSSRIKKKCKSCPPFPRGSDHKLPSSIFSLKSFLLKICASEQDPLDPQSIHMNLYSASTRARGTRKKKPL